MSRAGKIGLWLLAATLIALVVSWFLLTHHRETRRVDLPPRGEASFNPLYALKLTLREAGQTAVSRQRLKLDAEPLGRRDTVVLYGDPRTLAASDLQRLEAFVKGGGHLILAPPPWSQSGMGNAASELAGFLPIKSALLEPKCLILEEKPQNRTFAFCADPRFSLDAAPPLPARWEHPEGGYVYARFPLEHGSVDLLADPGFLDNRGLRSAWKAAFVRQLLAPNWGEGKFHLIYSVDMPPLWRWLLEHAWRALLPAFLCLLLWLWMRAQRFGPLLPAPHPPRRSLLEHVDASAAHLLRYGQMAGLHRALLTAVQERLRRRDPLAATQAGDTQASLIAARTGLPAASIRAALDTRPPRDLADFHHRIARLLELRKRL